MLSLIPGHASRAAQPTARLSNTSTTVRQRLFGARSTAFLVFMAVGLFASLPYCLFPSVQWEPLVRALVIFAGPPLSTAYNLRFRSIPAWLSVGWISVVAGVPVPFAIGFGFLAMVLYYLHERAIDQLDAQARVQTRTELRPLVRRLVIVKIGTALALAPAVATAGVRFLIGRGISLEYVMALLVLSGAVFGYFVYRHVRQFDESVVGRPDPR